MKSRVDIEHTFEASRREPVPPLSPDQKTALFQRIVTDAAAGAESLDGAATTTHWWHRWPLVAVGAVGVAGVAIIIAAQLPNSTSSPEVAHKGAPVNTTANVGSNTNEQQQHAEEPGKRIAMEPRLRRDDFRSYMGGFGGGPSQRNYALWHIDRAVDLSTDVPAASILTPSLLSVDDMKRTAATLGVDDSALYTFDSFVSTSDHPDFRYCASYFELPFDSCMLVNASGQVYWYQKEAHSVVEGATAATQDGFAQAKRMVASLTGIPEEELTVLKNPYPIFGPDETFGYDEYDVVPTYSPTSTLPFRPWSWHIALRNQKLEILFGRILPVHDELASTPIELISQEEAYQRFLEEYTRDDTEGDGTSRYRLGRQFPFLASVGEDSEIDVRISDISLEYEFMEDMTIRTDEGVGTSANPYRLVPVYRIIGVEADTGVPFEELIDASVDGNLNTIYSVVF